MTARQSLHKISTLALQRRRQGLVQLMPQLEETLRGSLMQRYSTCGNPNCKCAGGERHGPNWYFSVTLGPGETTGGTVAAEQLDRVRRWIENYHTVKQQMEKISAINRELPRRERKKIKRKK